MFWIFDHLRIRLAAGKVERSASVAAGMPGSGVFDDELARLRQDWVDSHRVFSAAHSSERERAIQTVHANASAYFDYLDRIRVEDHVPMQISHGHASASPAMTRTLLRLAPSS